MFLLGFASGFATGALLVVFFARRNLNTLKKGSDTLHTATDNIATKIKQEVDKRK
jgi:hypothetical protein